MKPLAPQSKHECDTVTAENVFSINPSMVKAAGLLAWESQTPVPLGCQKKCSWKRSPVQMCGARRKVWSLMAALVWGRLVPAPPTSQWEFLKRPFDPTVYVTSIRISNSEQNMLYTSKIYKLKSINHSKTVKWAFCLVLLVVFYSQE